MSEEFKVIKGIQPTKVNVLIYGVAGIGKTHIASIITKAILLDVENGSKFSSADRVEINNWNELVKALKWASEKEEYETVCIDSYTRVEKMMGDHICQEHGWPSLDKPGYGRGFEILKSYAVRFCDYLEKLNRRGKNTLVIAHSRVRTFVDPTSEAYDRYEPDCHKNTLPYLIAFFDALLFYRWKSHVKEAEKGDRFIARGTGDRELLTVERPAYIAKNRLGLEEVIVNPSEEFVNDVFRR